MSRIDQFSICPFGDDWYMDTIGNWWMNIYQVNDLSILYRNSLYILSISISRTIYFPPIKYPKITFLTQLLTTTSFGIYPIRIYVYGSTCFQNIIAIANNSADFLFNFPRSPAISQSLIVRLLHKHRSVLLKDSFHRNVNFDHTTTRPLKANIN